MIIKDGVGSGSTAKVNSENRLDTSSVTKVRAQFINEVYEKTFNIFFEAIDPTGADDYFYYFKNTGTSNIHLTRFRMASSVAGTVELHYVTGTATATTPATPVNRFIGSSKTITATSGTAVDITGLSNAGTLTHLRLAVVDTDYVVDFPGNIIVPPGQAVALLWDQATGVLKGNMEIYEAQGIL